MSESDISAIKVSTVRIEEQLKALTAAVSVQHEALGDRVKKLEDAQSWIVKGVVGTAMTAIFAAAGLGKKIGL